MSYGYGGGRANPYDQRGGNAPQQGYANAPQPAYANAPQQSYGNASPQYGGQQYGNAPAMGRDEYSGNNVELEPLTPNGGQFATQSQGDPKQELLKECRSLDQAIDDVNNQELRTIKQLQQASLNNADATASTAQLDRASQDIMETYRMLVGRIRVLKGKPEAAGQAQVGRIDRKAKDAIRSYQTMDADFRKKLQEQIARQFRIVRPDASEAEVQEAVEGNNQQQVFSQALMQSNRRGQAQSTLSAVQSRHDEIQNIERQLIELAELFQDMDNLVVQQEAAVVNIEMKGEEVVENMDKGNEQLTTGIKSARNARKWKWWCLGIVVLIIAIIVIVVLIYKFVIQNNNTSTNKSNKRFILPDLSSRSTPSLESRSEVPGLKWTRGNTLTPLVEGRIQLPDVEWTGDKKARSFQA